MLLFSRGTQQLMDVSAQKAKSEDPLLAVLEWNVEVDTMPHIGLHICWILDVGLQRMG